MESLVSGRKAEMCVLIPKIDLSLSIEEVPFQMKRRSFSVRLAYAMTISKARGKSFKKIKIYLPNPVFSHGQLYVYYSLY